MVFWKSLSNWPLAAKLDDLVASNFLTASQVEAVGVEVLLSSQGSRIVSMKDSSIAFLSRSVLITFKSSEPSKEVHPGSIEAFCYASLVAIANVKRCTLSFSRVSPHHDQFLRLLDLICVSVTTVRRHDVALPSISATVFTTPRPHGLTIVELYVAYTKCPAGSTDRYSPAAVIKGNPLPRTADAKAPFPSELGIITALVLPPASLGPTATRVSHPILQGKPNASHVCARIILHTHDRQNESNTIAVINHSRVKPVRYPLLHPERWTRRSEHNDN
jgi:hypothetical protein